MTLLSRAELHKHSHPIFRECRRVAAGNSGTTEVSVENASLALGSIVLANPAAETSDPGRE